MRTTRGTAQAIFGAGALLLVLLLAGFVLRDGALFNRALELDEWHTLLVVRQSSPSDVLAALGQGADFNPPLLHLWYWLLGSVGGGVTPLQLRLTAFASVWLAVVGLFLHLRRGHGWLPALTGSLLVLASSEVVHHAFEARFYGPWLLLTVLHVTTLARAGEQPTSVARQMGACITAALLCLIHYFGVITLLLVSLGMLIANRGERHPARAIVPSVVAALVALGCTLPLLAQQRNALSLPTWIWPPTAWSVAVFGTPAILLLAVGGWAIRPYLATSGERRADPEQRRITTAFWLLALLPLILIGFSLAVQSVLLPRYALPATLAVGVVAAMIAARLRRPSQVAVAAFALVAAGLAAVMEANRAAAFRQRVDDDRASLREVVASGKPIAVASPTVLYPLLDVSANPLVLGMAVAPPSAIRRRFPEGTDSAALGNAMIVVQDVAEIDRRLFGVPRTVTADSLSRIPCFYLLELWDAPGFAERWLPDRETVRVRPHLFLVRDRSTVGNSTTRASCT